MSRILIIAIIFITIISCKPDVENTIEEPETISLQEKATISSIGITLSPKSNEEVATWEKYQLIETKMQRYQSITKSEAMQNSEELSLLIEDASDTIDVKILDRPDVKMRFNVMYNHALRLNDMLTITNITEDEVMAEVTRLLDAYSALNDKINVVFKIYEYKNTFGIYELDTAIFAGKGNMLSDDEMPKNEELIRSDKSKNNPNRLQPSNQKKLKKNGRLKLKEPTQIKEKQ
ncbi:MAG: hypothetical protein PSN34_07825 [Urechidicola sp.]|nr:hypothetical protein [Urechidicola sp.]